MSIVMKSIYFRRGFFCLVIILLLGGIAACSLPSPSGVDVPALTEEPIESQGPTEDQQAVGKESGGEVLEQLSSGVLQAAPFYLTELGYFDFDKGSGIDGSAPISDIPDPALPDILFRNDHIEAQEGVLLTVWGGEEPGFEDCRNASLSDISLPTEKLRIGNKVCFQTDQDRYGFFTVDDLFVDNFGDLVMGFSYILWDEGGAALPPFRALYPVLGGSYPRGASGKDLDFYRNHRVADVSFQRVSETAFEIHVVGGAEIAYWGMEMPSYEDCAGLTLTQEREIVGIEIVPQVSPVKDTPFFCFSTNEGRLGRLYPRLVYFDATMAPLPYGDTMAFRELMDAVSLVEGEGDSAILVEYTADTWVLDGEAPSVQVPQRTAEAGVSGRVFFPFHDSFDFDTGSSLADFRSIHEVKYQGDDETQKAVMYPEYEDVLLGVWGDVEPSYQDCRGAALSNESVPLEERQYVCFQTSTGRFGHYRINSFYYDPATSLDNPLLMFSDVSYILWTFDGAQHALHSARLPIDDGGEWLYPGKYDLDMMLGSRTFDISLAADDPEQVQLTPTENASLAYWGNSMPEHADCASLPLGKEALTVDVSPVQDYGILGYNKLVAPVYYCYQTDEGRFGALEFGGTYFSAEANLLSLIVSAETLFDEGVAFEEIAAQRDIELDPEAGGSTEVIQPETPGGVIASGEVWLPNAVSYDFFNEQILEDFSGGDVGLEFSPDTLEGCFISISMEGGVLEDVSGDLANLGQVEPDSMSNGCLPIQVNTTYLVQRWQVPGMVVLFRVTAFDADGVTLEYIIK